MAEGQKSNILKAMEYRKSDLFSRLKGENQFILDSNFRKLYIVLYQIILNICPFPCIQTYTHTHIHTYSESSAYSIFSSESKHNLPSRIFRSKTKIIHGRKSLQRQLTKANLLSPHNLLYIPQK